MKITKEIHSQRGKETHPAAKLKLHWAELWKGNENEKSLHKEEKKQGYENNYSLNKTG